MCVYSAKNATYAKPSHETPEEQTFENPNQFSDSKICVLVFIRKS